MFIPENDIPSDIPRISLTQAREARKAAYKEKFGHEEPDDPNKINAREWSGIYGQRTPAGVVPHDDMFRLSPPITSYDVLMDRSAEANASISGRMSVPVVSTVKRKTS